MTNEPTIVATGGATPLGDAERITTLDVTRGVALFGILIMNIVPMAMPGAAYFNPNAYGGAEGLDLTAWLTVATFFESTMRTLFSLLFGAGTVLFMDRLSEKLPGNRASEIYMRRNVLLVIFGIVNAYLLLWIGDILYTYGLVALFLYVVRGFSSRGLIILIALLVAFNFGKNAYQYQEAVAVQVAGEEALTQQKAGVELNEAQKEALKTWNHAWESQNPAPEEFDRQIADKKQGWWHNVVAFAGVAHYFETQMTYGFFFLDALLCMSLGILLYRHGFLTLDRPTWNYVVMVVVGYGAGATMRYILAMDIVEANYAPAAFERYDMALDVGRLLVGGAHLGLIMLFCRSGILRWLHEALASVGRMALTNYIAHSIMAVFLFTGTGFAWYGDLARHEVYYVWTAVCVIQLIYSPIWLKYFRYGPLEWGWRSLTYGKAQSFKK